MACTNEPGGKRRKGDVEPSIAIFLLAFCTEYLVYKHSPCASGVSLVLKYTIRGVDTMLKTTPLTLRLFVPGGDKRLPRNRCLSPDPGLGSVVLDFELLDEFLAYYLTEGMTAFKHCLVDVPLFCRKHSHEATSSRVLLLCFPDYGIDQALDANIVLVIVAFQQSTWTRCLSRIAISVIAAAAAETPRSSRCQTTTNSGRTCTCY